MRKANMEIRHRREFLFVVARKLKVQGLRKKKNASTNLRVMIDIVVVFLKIDCMRISNFKILSQNRGS